MIIKEIKKQKGATLMELLIAIAVINFGLFAVWGLYLANYNGEQEAQARIVGANLAREGVEAAKNIRDSNWLKTEDGVAGITWDSGLSGGVGDPSAVVSGLLESDSVALDFTVDSIDAPEAMLYLNSDGFYDSDAAGTSTGYRRILVINSICCADADDDLKCDNNTLVFKTEGQMCDGAADEIKVGIDIWSRVFWRYGEGEREFIAQDQIFNWR